MPTFRLGRYAAAPVLILLAALLLMAGLADCGSAPDTSTSVKKAATGKKVKGEPKNNAAKLSEKENLRIAKEGEPMSTGVPGCRCHATSVGLRTMHKRFNMMQCATCHLGDPMQKKGGKTDIAAARKRRLTDDKCVECHKTDDAKKAEDAASKDKRFCIKCQKSYSDDFRYCPKDGSQLVDIDKLTVASMKGKSNAVCVVCHTPESKCIVDHPKRTAGFSPGDCLACHKNHWDCKGCHH